MDKKDRYEDIIGLKHPTSKRHIPMSRQDRAAQFSPFSALVGYDDVISEEARLTEGKRELSEDCLEELDRRFHIILDRIGEHPLVSIRYFTADKRKTGGFYAAKKGRIVKVDEYEKAVLFDDKTKIFIKDIIEVESRLFDGYNM